MKQAELVLVTVTYGDRLAVLSLALRKAFEQSEVSRAVVVDNGATCDLETLRQEWGARIELVRQGKNTGSAGGYGAGIDAALRGGAGYIWLMDDDNAPEAGAARLLLGELERLIASRGAADVSVMGLRQSDASALQARGRTTSLPDSFFGFDILDIPGKLARRLGMSAQPTFETPDMLDLPYTQYGGFLAPREVFDRLGRPLADLVLYADDWEYTGRLTSRGGVIRLVTKAAIADLQPSLYQDTPAAFSFLQHLRNGSDFRIYYEFRNHAWLEQRIVHSRLRYALNRTAFFMLLAIFAAATGRLDRFRLIGNAVSDGRKSLLGINASHPLPS